jgi:hypothetical protein
MTMVTGSYFNLDTNSSSFFLALSTFVSYNSICFLKYNSGLLKAAMHSWISSHYILLILLNLIASIKVVVFVFQLSLVELLVLFPFAILTVLYMLPVFSFKGISYPLRKIPGLKIFCIAISWAGLVTFFPLVEKAVPIGIDSVLFFVQQFIFVLVLTIPFDIRDMNFDAKELKTIPFIFGLDTTKRIAFFLLLTINIVSVVFFNFNEVIVLCFISLVLTILIWNSESRQSKYYASFWVEGIPILWFATLYLFDAIA